MKLNNNLWPRLAFSSTWSNLAIMVLLASVWTILSSQFIRTFLISSKPFREAFRKTEHPDKMLESKCSISDGSAVAQPGSLLADLQTSSKTLLAYCWSLLSLLCPSQAMIASDRSCSISVLGKNVGPF